MKITVFLTSILGMALKDTLPPPSPSPSPTRSEQPKQKQQITTDSNMTGQKQDKNNFSGNINYVVNENKQEIIENTTNIVIEDGSKKIGIEIEAKDKNQKSNGKVRINSGAKILN